MKKQLWVFCLLLSGQVLLAQNKAQHPNILIIFADDLGWADLSSYGSTFYETPVLDQLALEGTKFTQGYATSPVCSPTRASLMTGKYPVKTGVTDWIPGRQANGNVKPYEKMVGAPTANELGLQENTLAEQAKKSGYKTFFAGKWHLGETEEFWPDYQGFEINKGGWSKGGPTGKKGDTTGGYFTPYGNPRLPDGPPGEYITDRLAEECIRYIENIGAEPFMMVYSLYAVHNPMQAPTELVKKYERKRLSLPNQGENVFVKDEPWMKFENGWRRRAVQDLPVYAAMVENMDTNIGHIVAKLKEKGLYENTLIIFTSDNGGLSTAEGSPTVNGPLRAGKGWLYEGGIRVPFIMHWNGKIAANTTREVPVTVADIFPTVAKVMDNNYQTDPTLDGKNIFEWMAKPAKFNNRTLYWHYPHYSNQGGKPGAAIREGKWKLIYNYEDASVELYDLVTDVGERTDLSTQHKKRTDRLNKKLMHWLKDRNAKAPVRNMEYREEKKP